MSSRTSPHIDFAKIIAPVAIQILGEPNPALSTKTKLCWGKRGSFVVDLTKGTWCDHEDGDKGGGVLDLLKVKLHLEKDAALQWLRDHQFLPPAEGSSQPKIVATYDYQSADAKLLFQVVRRDPKDFRQRRPDGNGGWVWKMTGVEKVIYRLPQVISANAAGRTVFVAEGEKGVAAAEGLGLVATCSPGGAGKWRAEYSPWLRNADVVLLPDNDQAGREHVEQVAGFLRWFLAPPM